MINQNLHTALVNSAYVAYGLAEGYAPTLLDLVYTSTPVQVGTVRDINTVELLTHTVTKFESVLEDFCVSRSCLIATQVGNGGHVNYYGASPVWIAYYESSDNYAIVSRYVESTATEFLDDSQNTLSIQSYILRLPYGAFDDDFVYESY